MFFSGTNIKKKKKWGGPQSALSITISKLRCDVPELKIEIEHLVLLLHLPQFLLLDIVMLGIKHLIYLF